MYKLERMLQILVKFVYSICAKKQRKLLMEFMHVEQKGFYIATIECKWKINEII